MAQVLPEVHLRPCLVDRGTGPHAKALFHRWAYEAYVDKTPLFRGGSRSEGQVCRLWGIVEMEDGKVTGVPPETIRFLDNKFQDYVWPEGGETYGPI